MNIRGEMEYLRCGWQLIGMASDKNNSGEKAPVRCAMHTLNIEHIFFIEVKCEIEREKSVFGEIPTRSIHIAPADDGDIFN